MLLSLLDSALMQNVSTFFSVLIKFWVHSLQRQMELDIYFFWEKCCLHCFITQTENSPHLERRDGWVEGFSSGEGTEWRHTSCLQLRGLTLWCCVMCELVCRDRVPCSLAGMISATYKHGHTCTQLLFWLFSMTWLLFLPICLYLCVRVLVPMIYFLCCVSLCSIFIQHVSFVFIQIYSTAHALLTFSLSGLKLLPFSLS